MVRFLFVGSAVAMCSAAFFAGCGGTLAPATATDGGSDAPNGTSSGVSSSGVSSSGIGSSSSSSSGVSSSSSGTGSSSGVGSSGSSSGTGSSSGVTDDDGGTCPSGGSFPYAGYVTPATPQQGSRECSSANIQSFVGACLATGSGNACDAWYEANVGGADGGGGTPCGNCLFNQTNPSLGGVWYGIAGQGGEYFAPNYGACVALLDPANGPACATAYDDNSACQVYACGPCATGGAYTNCAEAVDQASGLCASQTTSESTACGNDFADGGVGTTTCSPTNVYDPSDTDYTYDFEFIANLICGNGATTFNPDGG